ncbi:hypothetical protein HRbin26_02132 [bacterium HR26]|nr:hypothetical protein HRbin26_02132 [bacterium HR26]
MGVLLGAVEQALLLQVARDRLRHLDDPHPGQPVEAVEVDAVLVQRRHHRQVELLAELVVLPPGTRCDMDDAGSLLRVHLVPGDHPVRHALHGRQLVERPAVGQADERAAGQLLQHLVVAAQRCPGRILRQVVDMVTLAHLHVGELGVDRYRHVGRQRPGCRRPDEQRLVLAPLEREADVEAQVRDLLVALADLHLREAGGAAGAPRHHVVAVVDPPILVAHLEEMPDHVVVLVGEGVVRVVPVHEVAEPFGLLGLDSGVLEHPLLALLDEAVDAVSLDVLLRREAQLLLDLDLHPQPLAVEAVLVALAIAEHGVEALVEVFVGAAPGVVHAHRVVGRDRAVEERPALLALLVLLQVLLDDPGLVPPAQELALHRGEVDISSWHWLEHRSTSFCPDNPPGRQRP